MIKLSNVIYLSLTAGKVYLCIYFIYGPFFLLRFKVDYIV